MAVAFSTKLCKDRQWFQIMVWFFQSLLASDKPELWIDFGLLIVGLAYTIFAGFQWVAIRRQTKIADRSAQAASDANRIATETLVITRRARIRIEDVRFFSTEEIPAVNFRLFNSGEIPATGIVKYPRKRVAEIGYDEVRPDDHIREPNPQGTSVIVDPHSQTRLYWWNLTLPYEPGKESTLTDDEWQHLMGGESNIQLGICIVYWDGFGNKRRTENWYAYEEQKWEREATYQN